MGVGDDIPFACFSCKERKQTWELESNPMNWFKTNCSSFWVPFLLIRFATFWRPYSLCPLFLSLKYFDSLGSWAWVVIRAEEFFSFSFFWPGFGVRVVGRWSCSWCSVWIVAWDTVNASDAAWRVVTEVLRCCLWGESSIRNTCFMLIWDDERSKAPWTAPAWLPGSQLYLKLQVTSCFITLRLASIDGRLIWFM
jgi:hypothetical protein